MHTLKRGEERREKRAENKIGQNGSVNNPNLSSPSGFPQFAPPTPHPHENNSPQGLPGRNTAVSRDRPLAYLSGHSGPKYLARTRRHVGQSIFQGERLAWGNYTPPVLEPINQRFTRDRAWCTASITVGIVARSDSDSCGSHFHSQSRPGSVCILRIRVHLTWDEYTDSMGTNLFINTKERGRKWPCLWEIASVPGLIPLIRCACP
jgi:hypothetical protein